MTSMMRLRLRVTLRVISASFAWSKYRLAALMDPRSFFWSVLVLPVGELGLFSTTNRGSAMDARLHTAVSSGEVNSTISVQRLDERMVPRFCWLDLRLHASLKSMYGLPVSTCDSRMANQSCCALIVFLPLPSDSYLAYNASNSSPQQSARPGDSLGQNKVHSPLASTRFMNKSLVQRP